MFKAVIDSRGRHALAPGAAQYVDQTNHHGLVEWFKNLIGQPVPANEVKPVTLMEDGSPATRYVAQTGLLNPVDKGPRFPNHLSPMTPEGRSARACRRPEHAGSGLRVASPWAA